MTRQNRQRNAYGWWERLPPKRAPRKGDWGYTDPEVAFYTMRYNQIIDDLTKIYNVLPDNEQAIVAELDNSFHTGSPTGFVNWANSVLPSAFEPYAGVVDSSGRPTYKPLTVWPHDFFPKDIRLHNNFLKGTKLYRGTNIPDKIVTDGVCVPSPAETLTDDEFGWYALWQDIIFDGYKDLSKKQKNKLHSFWGEDIGIEKCDLENLVSLIFVSECESTARDYMGNRGALFEVDIDKIAWFWIQSDQIQGERSHVLVMPQICPQALPEAFELLDVGKDW